MFVQAYRTKGKGGRMKKLAALLMLLCVGFFAWVAPKPKSPNR